MVTIALAARALGLATAHQSAVIIYAGFLGTVIDSVLGALFERRGWINNDLVNLLSTSAAAVIAWMMR